MNAKYNIYKEMHTQVHHSQLLNDKDKEKNLKTINRKMTFQIYEISVRLKADLVKLQ